MSKRPGNILVATKYILYEKCANPNLVCAPEAKMTNPDVNNCQAHPAKLQ
jgi:hypothetical protein